MVIIKKISWLSRPAKEAKVTITDGTFDLLCFAHPFGMEQGDAYTEQLQALDPYDILKITEEVSAAKKLNSSFDYLISGTLVDRESGLVQIGEILIDIGSQFIPGDFVDGDLISFKCDRLDL